MIPLIECHKDQEAERIEALAQREDIDDTFTDGPADTDSEEETLPTQQDKGKNIMTTITTTKQEQLEQLLQRIGYTENNLSIAELQTALNQYQIPHVPGGSGSGGGNPGGEPSGGGNPGGGNSGGGEGLPGGVTTASTVAPKNIRPRPATE